MLASGQDYSVVATDTGSIHRLNGARQGQCSETAALSGRSAAGDDGGGTSEHQHQSAHGRPNAWFDQRGCAD
jgi:hypothetical protein